MVVMGMGHPGGPRQALKADGDNKSQAITAIAWALLAGKTFSKNFMDLFIWFILCLSEVSGIMCPLPDGAQEGSTEAIVRIAFERQ